MENPLEEILNVLNMIIKYDYKVKLSVLLTAVSAYTPQPINLLLKGSSGSGKTHNATRVLKIFPKRDVWRIGRLSPTALIHLRGELVTEDGFKVKDLPRPDRTKQPEEWRKYRDLVANAHREIDLRGKILLFLDAPHPDTFQMLYPILSHDETEIEYRITDRSAAGSLETKYVVIKNWPATIFIRAKEDIVSEEFRSRCFTVCPEETSEKISAANALTHMLNAYPFLIDEINTNIAKVKVWISCLTEEILKISNIAIPFAELDKFHPAEITADMREFAHLEAFIKCLTALNMYKRVRMQYNNQTHLLATEEDVKNAWLLFLQLFETSRTGISEHILDFYHNILAQKESFLLKEAVAMYNMAYRPKRSRKTVERYLKILEEQSYLSSDEDPEDKRRLIYKPILGSVSGEKWTNQDKQKMSIILNSDLTENFENWRKNMDIQTPKYNILNDGKEIEISSEDLQKYILQKPSGMSTIFRLFSFSVQENKTEKMDKQEMSQIVHISSENRQKFNFNQPLASLVRTLPIRFLQCEICGALGQEWLAKNVKGETASICDSCAKKLKEKWGLN